MGACFSKPKQPIENEVELFILKPRPSFSSISQCNSIQIIQNPSNQHTNEKCPIDKTCDKSYEETVESLLSYLYSIFNRKCPHCKKQIKSCGRTKRQIRSIFTTFQEKVILMNLSNREASPESAYFSKLLAPPRNFATVRQSVHEKKFLSFELESSLSSIFRKPESNYDNAIRTEIIFKSKELLLNNSTTETNYEDCDSITENGSYNYSDRTDNDYMPQPPIKERMTGSSTVSNAFDNLTLFLPVLIEDTGIPLCLSQKCNKEMWG